MLNEWASLREVRALITRDFDTSRTCIDLARARTTYLHSLRQDSQILSTKYLSTLSIHQRVLVWSRFLFFSAVPSIPHLETRSQHAPRVCPLCICSFKTSVLKPQKSGLRVLLPDHAHKRSLAEPDPPHHHESKAFVVTNQSSHFVQTNLIFYTSPV